MRNSFFSSNQSVAEYLLGELISRNFFFRSLNNALEKSKKKYEFRIKHLEQQILQTLIQGDSETNITARPLISLPSDLESNKSESD